MAATTDELLDQEILFLELGALHLIAHPRWRHATARPLQGLVLLGLIFRLWFGAAASFALARCDGLNRPRRLLGHVAAKLGQLTLEIRALLSDLPGQHALQVIDVCPELSDVHRGEGLADAFLTLRAGWTTAPLCLLGHGSLNHGR